MRIISRYLLRQHIAPLGFALAALTSLMLLNQIAKQFGSLVGKGLPATVILEVFVLSVPFIVAVTLPMAVLVAVLYTFSHLAADNEITALRASGVSMERLLAPAIAGAAFVSLLAFLWSDQLLPRSNHRLRTLLVDIQRKKPSFTLREQVINEVVARQFFLRAARIDPATNRLRDVTIYDLEDPERRRVITADSGHMAYTPGGQDLYLTLFDGDIQEVKRAEPGQFSRTFYKENIIRVAGIGNTLVRTVDDQYHSDREMSVCQMERVVRLARAEEARARTATRRAVSTELYRLVGLADSAADPTVADSGLSPPSLACRLLARVGGWLTPDSAMAAQVPRSSQVPARRPRSPKARTRTAFDTAAVDLDSLEQAAPAVPGQVRPFVPSSPRATEEEQRTRAARQRAAMYLVEIHKKLAIAAACFVFTLVGVPIALRFPRGGIGLVIGVSLSVFTIYYVGLIGGEELGDRLIVSPFVSMWIPNIAFTLLGIAGWLVVRRETGTARGGDWSDLKDLLRPLVRRRA